jgi:hypothetical protein
MIVLNQWTYTLLLLLQRRMCTGLLACLATSPPTRWEPCMPARSTSTPSSSCQTWSSRWQQAASHHLG